MRLAILSDVHGNDIALDAVLADAGAVDAYWVLGDLAAIGPRPVACLETLARLPNVRFVRGNTDRYVVAGDRPGPSHEEVLAEPPLMSRLVEMERGFAWTQGAVTARGWMSFMCELPVEQRLTLPDGTRVLGVHAAPGTDDGPGMAPHHTDDELRSRLAAAAADLVFCGHTHVPMDRTVDGDRIINLGSVSNPFRPDLRAKYAILEASEADHDIQTRRVDYDHEAVVAACEAERFPGAAFVARFMRGRFGGPGVRE